MIASGLARGPGQPHADRRSAGQAVVEFALLVPVALLLLLAIADFARLYTTAITVESAVREAADYGAFSNSNWLSANSALTWAGMQQRACTSASTLPDYQSTDPLNKTCTNPTITYTLDNPSGIDCSATVPSGALPCVVHVHGHYDFKLIVSGLSIPGLFTFPSTVSIDREASYVVNDFPSP